MQEALRAEVREGEDPVDHGDEQEHDDAAGVLAAQAMDYAHTTWLLDDGDRADGEGEDRAREAQLPVNFSPRVPGLRPFAFLINCFLVEIAKLNLFHIRVHDD